MTAGLGVAFAHLKTCILLAVVALGGMAAIVVAQTSAVGEGSPKGTVEEFWKLETAGGRLTTDGWYKASRFFVRMTPSAGPLKRVIHVTLSADTAKVEESARTENWAEVSVSPYLLGDIDSALHFTPTPKRGAYGVINLQWTTVVLHLVLTNKQWKIKDDGGRDRETTGAPQWLIDCDSIDLWIDKDVAIRYVTDIRDQSPDQRIKRNANETLTELQNLRSR